MKEAIKAYIPQDVLNTYGKARRRLEKSSRHVPDDEVVSFNLASIYDGHFNIHYRNVPAFRCPFDYVIYQMILSEVKPDLIIEIGTNYGGTTLYLADLLNTLGHGTVHSIDIEDRSPAVVKNHPRVKLFSGGWQDYALTEAKGFSTILIIDDGSHMYEDTLGILEKFAPLVSIGSYFIVEDGIINELGLSEKYHGGPLRAIREFLPEHGEFMVDRRYCDMFGKNATFNVNGYLQRIAP